VKVSQTLYETPYGSFKLTRYPARSKESLLPWCGADTLLLDALYAHPVSPAGTLVVNDSQGAISIALQPKAAWTDSSIAQLALAGNEQQNEGTATEIIWSTQHPPSTQYVALRVPKQRRYFEHQLSVLASTLAEGATIFAAGMDKHLSPHTADLLEKYIGPTQRHRGRLKARLFTATKDSRKAPGVSSQSSYYCEFLDATLISQPNVFSADALDLGSRFLLSQLHSLAPAETLVDLACGNGVLGLSAYKAGLASNVIFIDESAMAVASAQSNAQQLYPDHSQCFSFHQGDGLANYAGAQADLIICNPPFHMDHTVDDFSGKRLLLQCAEHTAPGGKLCVVANRHLDYQSSLKRSFGRIEKLATNSKFNIFLAHKSR
jgi:23S rRNA (guanine1835-N2)-methyltransferase